MAQKDTKMGKNFVSALDEGNTTFIVQLYHLHLIFQPVGQSNLFYGLNPNAQHRVGKQGLAESD